MASPAETARPGWPSIGRSGGAKRRAIVTPEGVALPVTLAPRGDRAAALLLDLIFIYAPIVGIVILFGIMWLGGAGSNWILGMAILISFLVRSFYFVFFELRWQGVTPGKRILKLRVIDRKGGELTAGAVFARNLMREVEVFMPLQLLLSLGAGTLADLLMLAWAAIFVFMPFLNSDSLRAGDLVGGTWVIRDPKAVLVEDVAERAAEGPAVRSASGTAIEFTPEQLGHYGIYELQTLEEVLREEGPYAEDTRAEIARRIQRKIGWPQNRAVDAKAFLEAFYAAQRGRLERGLLFGKRRESKYDEE